MAIISIGLLFASRIAPTLFKSRLTAPRIATIVLVTAIIPWTQWIGGISLFSGDALICSLYIVFFATAITLGYSYSNDAFPLRQSLGSFVDAIWFVALISAAIGVLQWLGLQDSLGMYVVQTDPGDRAMGNLGQPNQLASLLLMGICGQVWTFEKRRIGPTGLICAVAFMSLALVLTQSRAGILSAVAISIIIIWKTYNAATLVRPWHVVMWLAVYITSLQLLPMLHEVMLMDESRNLSLTRDNGRFVIWNQVIAGILDSPWTGYGWNQTPTAHAMGAIYFPGSMTYTNAHNVVLDIIAWNGIPLGIIISIACAYWYFTRLFSIRNVNSIYAFGCITTIAIHSLLEYPFAYSYFLLSAGVMIGVVEFSSPKKRAAWELNKSISALALLGCFVIGGRIIYEYILIEEDFRVVRFENMHIGQTPESYSAPKKIWLLTQLGGMLDAGRQQPERNMLPDEIESLRRTSLRFPYGALGLRYALALGLNEQPEKATRQMQIVRGMYGEYFYQAAVSVLRSMEQDKYPELKKVITP